MQNRTKAGIPQKWCVHVKEKRMCDKHVGEKACKEDKHMDTHTGALGHRK